jgi:hypothetical protein
MALSNGCTLSIMASRPDVPYMMQTVPHIVRACHHSCVERVLIVDTAPLHKRYRANPNMASLDQLRACCRQLIDQKVIDQAIDIDYSPASRKRLCMKHYGRRLRNTHDFRGCPVLGLPFAMERSVGRYLLHFDADVLIHQDPGFDWVARALELMGRHADMMFVAPLAGPPHPSGELKQGTTRYERDPDGFFRFKMFTQRKFLVDRERLKALLPMTPKYTSWRRRWLGLLTGSSALWTWEYMMDQMLKASNYIRADLSCPQAWTLHTPDHGPAFVAKLPAVIERIEAGSFPPDQAGDYDLRVEKW